MRKKSAAERAAEMRAAAIEAGTDALRGRGFAKSDAEKWATVVIEAVFGRGDSGGPQEPEARGLNT